MSEFICERSVKEVVNIILKIISLILCKVNPRGYEQIISLGGSLKSPWCSVGIVQVLGLALAAILLCFLLFRGF